MNYIDVDRLREAGQDLASLTSEFNEEINALFTRISNMNTKTFEWVGPSSNEFIRRANIEKIQYMKLIESLNKYSRILIDCADSYSAEINKVR